MTSVIFLLVLAGVPSEGAAESLSELIPRVRLLAGESSVTFVVSEGAILEAAGIRQELAAGEYTVTVTEVQPAQERFHLFSKTFRPDQGAEEGEYIEQWRAKGYRPEVVTIGKRFETLSGAVFDGRVHWVSIAQLPGRDAAEAKQSELEAAEQWTWMHAERVRPGKGTVHVTGADGVEVLRCVAPLRLQPAPAVSLGGSDASYRGRLEIGVDPGGLLECVETLGVEDYLRGVLPAEMPEEWPLEALKAQAVAARSEVFASAAGKHRLEGFDFCAEQHCRAYLGSGGGPRGSDAAVEGTRGEILTQGLRIVPAVFSANCGGWTEDNETVWRAPAHGALRGVSDLAPDGTGRGPEEAGIANWILRPPEAYCSGDGNYFRWVRSFSAKELGDWVNRRYAVGRIRDIELGERGKSGRLKWLRVVGTKKTETIRKELPIRLAFGGLPSALFVLDVERGPRGPSTFTFKGGGRGHGVGLCQHGAKGMALRGMVYTDILRRYFSDVTIARYR